MLSIAIGMVCASSLLIACEGAPPLLPWSKTREPRYVGSSDLDRNPILVVHLRKTSTGPIGAETPVLISSTFRRTNYDTEPEMNSPPPITIKSVGGTLVSTGYGSALWRPSELKAGQEQAYQATLIVETGFTQRDDQSCDGCTVLIGGKLELTVNFDDKGDLRFKAVEKQNASVLATDFEVESWMGNVTPVSPQPSTRMSPSPAL